MVDVPRTLMDYRRQVREDADGANLGELSTIPRSHVLELADTHQALHFRREPEEREQPTARCPEGTQPRLCSHIIRHIERQKQGVD